MVAETVSRLEPMKRALKTARPKRRWWRRWTKRAAVAMILHQTDHDGVEVMMIKRAEKEGDPWSGHMAFPGGRMDPEDEHGLATAKRETFEEVGVMLDECSRCIGRLSDITGRAHKRRRPMVVTPYVFEVEKRPPTRINHEVAEIVWVPLSYLSDHNNRERMTWQRKKISLNLPCYFYQGRRIWGLSLLMLDELIDLAKASK